MSRCFPYPPPGFEKKARNDQSLDLLAKVKQKERKHKKEKRNKEKKHKEKNRDEHKEKKDRNERHKDKKRDKEKNKTSDDKRVEGQTSRHNHQKDEKREANQVLENVTGVIISNAEEANNSKYMEELGRRIEIEKKAAANGMLENSNCSLPKGVEDFGANSFSKEQRKLEGVSQAMEKVNHRHQSSNNYQSLPKGNQMVAKFSKEQRRADNYQASHNPRSLPNGNPMVSNFNKEQRGADNHQASHNRQSLPNGNSMVSNFSKEQRRADNHQASHNHQNLPNGNLMVSNFSKEQRRADNHQASHNHQSLPNGNPMVANFSKEKGRANGIIQPMEKVNQKHQALPHQTPVVPNSSYTEKRRVDEIPRAVEKGNIKHQALLQTPAEKDEVKNIEEKERGKDWQADNGHGDKYLDRERAEKKKKRKEKNRDKEKEKEEKKKRKKGNGEGSQKENDARKDTGRDKVGSVNFKPQVPHNSIENFYDNYSNSKKRKEIEMNGFLHEKEVRPNKLSKPASSSDKQNGKKMEFDHIHTASPSIKHVIPNNDVVEEVLNNKEQEINGTVVSRLPDDSTTSLAAPKFGRMNGFLHEIDVPPNKRRRPDQQNGKTLEFDHINTASTPVSHGTPNTAIAERVHNNKEHKINGTVVARSSPADSRFSLTAPKTGTINGFPLATDLRSPIINGIAVVHLSPADSKPLLPVNSSTKSNKVLTKLPHPDSKFLNQVNSIPRTDELPEYDDQDWLFPNKDHQPKPKEESKAQVTPEVWAQGLKIDSADIFALPYVIPY